MNEQLRAVLLSAVAAVAGWSGITTIGLLIQVASLQSDTKALQAGLEQNATRDIRLEDKIYEELKLLRQLLENGRGKE